MSEADQTAWHALTADEAVQRLKSSVTAGLDDSEATRRQAEYGLNVLPTARKRGPFMRFLQQFNNVLVYVLLAAGFIKLMMNLWLDASIILGVVIIDGLLGFLQEGRAEKSLDSIRNMLSAEARTLRNGQTSMIPAETLVPGDIVFLESGDKIPADIRLTDVKNLRTEEAALTGESVPSDKSTAPVSEKATVAIAPAWPIPERSSFQAARAELSLPPEAKRNSAASISCSPASARWKPRSSSRSRSSATRSRSSF